MDVIKDLGVYLDYKLLMDEHINNVSGKAFKNVGFVMLVCKPINDLNCIKIVYNAYVRSSLEHASPIWCPQYITLPACTKHGEKKTSKTSAMGKNSLRKLLITPRNCHGESLKTCLKGNLNSERAVKTSCELLGVERI
ncbi:putative RNA-directed DNA polymerase from transposon BS [Operophtera brumata]|uniref:Putative RNA-directed DNA polymerase from transposon BS n=1 Tax=Operophtera brumata TaxID=104452 RepID=A0A0L7KWE7_OPEBR|nr:putative RNA-directed DNA polymerase from transposon BS [Operophtera brumata]